MFELDFSVHNNGINFRQPERENMKKIFLFSSILLLNACAHTLQGAWQDTSNNLQNAAEYVRQSPDMIDHATHTIKRGGELIGKGMEATGEYLQEISK